MMYELINLIDKQLDNYNNDIDKVENFIINHVYYKKLDMDEQIVVIDEVRDKVINRKNKSDINVGKQVITQQSYNSKTISSGFGFGSGFGSGYGSKSNEYSKSTYKKKIVEPTIFMKDLNGNTVTEGEAMSSKTKAIMLTEITQEQYDKRSKIFEAIRSIILPEQRSPEWFEMRNGKITASDGGAVVGKNKHEPQYNFIMKKVFGSIFETGEACYHGKKFEQAVTLTYEYKNDVYTEEFGLLGHPEHYFLGASPDGICSPYKRDKVTPTPLVGRMLEIKCPLMRKIKYSGDIKDTICPIYYWCQVQLQLECCDLDECDFVQCNIEEYKNRQEWLDDTSEQFDFKSKKYGIERGVLLEILPAKLSEEDLEDGVVKLSTVYNFATFIYPKKIDMGLDEIDNWILNEIANLKPTMKLHRVVYWRLIENNCTLILRDTQWFKDNLITLKTIWSYVEFLRLNDDVAQQWKSFIESQNIKYNDKIIKKLIELIELKKNSLIDPNPNPNSNMNTDITDNIKSTKIKKQAKLEINIDTSNVNLEFKEETNPETVLNNEIKQKLDTKSDIKLKKKSESKESNIKTKKFKESKESKDELQLATEIIINQIPNVQLSDDSSDEDIVLPDIKRPSKSKK